MKYTSDDLLLGLSISVTRKQQVYIKRLYRHSVSMYHIVQELEEGGFDSHCDCKKIMQRKS